MKEVSNRKMIMKKYASVAVVFFLLFSFFGQARTSAQSSLDEYDLIARGTMSQERGIRPVHVARMDNNGEILLACVTPKTGEQLKSLGIRFIKSQLELLVDWDLLEYDGKNKTYRTTIHVFDVKKSSAIRQRVGEKVKQLEHMLAPDLETLKSHLAEIENPKSFFAILYAYVLHSYTMEQLGEEIYRTPQLSERHPFWNGYAWAIYPKNKFPVGVTFLPIEENQFYFVSAPGVPRMNFEQMIHFVKDASADRKVDDPELLETLSTFGLVERTGKLTIPVLENVWAEILQEMAKKVYENTVELAESEQIAPLLGMETQAQAVLFLHYEIRYAFLSDLLERAVIGAPVDFENEKNNGPGDMKNLVFWIKTDQSN